MAKLLNRSQLKADAKMLLTSAQVSPKGITALYLGITLLTNFISYFIVTTGIFSIFISILSRLLGLILLAGFILYFMDIRFGDRSEYLTLFDGFSFGGKVILLNILVYLLTFFWSMLLIIPGIIASYRYRFALFNLCENPDLSPIEAMSMSSRQTAGYKMQLFNLDISYIGWFLLASLPTVVISSYTIYTATVSGTPIPELLFTVPQLLMSDIWEVLVSLFYLPVYRCTELAYFDAAKDTSGIKSIPSDIWNNTSDHS